MPKRSSWVLHKILSTKKQASSKLEKKRGGGGREAGIKKVQISLYLGTTKKHWKQSLCPTKQTMPD